MFVLTIEYAKATDHDRLLTEALGLAMMMLNKFDERTEEYKVAKRFIEEYGK